MVGIDRQKLVRAWIALQYATPASKAYDDNFWAFKALSDYCESEPDRCWELINEIRSADGTDVILANLAAGPLEDLMVQHAQQFIGKVEKLAEEDEQFRRLLGALWQNDVSDEIWARIKRVAGPSF
jgi:hypothetical protein